MFLILLLSLTSDYKRIASKDVKPTVTKKVEFKDCKRRGQTTEAIFQVVKKFSTDESAYCVVLNLNKKDLKEYVILEGTPPKSKVGSIIYGEVYFANNARLIYNKKRIRCRIFRPIPKGKIHIVRRS